MYDFSSILPSLCVLIIFISYYIFLPRLPLRRSIVFFALLIIEALVITTDIVSSYADMEYKDFSVPFLYFINGLFYISFFLRSFAFYYYSVTLTRLKITDHPKIAILLRMPFYLALVLTISTPWTKAIFSIENDGFHHGFLINYLYVMLFFYILTSLVIIILRRNNFLRTFSFAASIGFNITLLTGAVIRKLFPAYLVMDTFCILAMIVIYLSFENPDIYIDQRAYVFNTLSLRLYINEISRIKDHKYAGCIIHNYEDTRKIYGAQQMDNGLRLIGRYLIKKYRRVFFFYNRNGRFIIIGNKQTNMDALINDIRKRFREPWKSTDTELYLDVNFATLQVYNEDYSADIFFNTLLNVLEKSDKQNSHECLIASDEDIKSIEKEILIKKTLEKTLENNSVEVYFQPIIQSSTSRIVGAEALARITDANENIIMPNDFIPVAEKNGNISNIGRQIFTKTCEFIRDKNISSMGINWINVNLSPTQFLISDLADDYSSIVKEYGINPDFIHLEITEESITDFAVMKRQIHNLNEKGFKFVLDDYGKGYSNLTRIKSCPFINIKLDMELVWAYCDDPDEIIPTMVHAFKEMGFSVTAEGVETDYMAEVMKAIGCDFQQGYHYSKPLPIKDFLSLANNQL
ncbi:EAL domain-containing protein [Butyrivibrio sp.]|uniref:EAL domain-containing protein n=1 Tax=Butyrivibrio sp. TaxID=28121 RepID=UPI0025C48FC8|nr:EAL domain-containing protein [Butyrivibrio sp.]MBQ9302491.1 EAL domain-containing protein [Butyrivibrio sp.]